MADDKLSQQVSLRISKHQRSLILARLEEMRKDHPKPETITEADAHRSLLTEAANMNEAKE